MKRLITKTLIVGAGPAGLAAAMKLAESGKEFIVVEKSKQVGGLAKTYIFKEGDLEFRTDNGPHRFFSKNPYLYEFIENILKERWIQVNRQTRQFIDGKFYDYPINAWQALKNIGFSRACKMFIDYLAAKYSYGLRKKPIKNFADYVYANFGRSLGEFNMINYTEKIWGIPASDIHPDWAGQRIKGLNIFALITDSFWRLVGLSGKKKPKSLVDVFYYPEFGSGYIYEVIAEKLFQKGYKILMKSEPKVFRHKNGKFYESDIMTPDGLVTIGFENLIETIPLTKFVHLLEPKTPSGIVKFASKLSHRHQIYLFLTLDKERITNDQWIYFPAKDIPFGRVSEMKNFSHKMSPEGKTSWFVELFCSESDKVWKMSDEEIFNLIMISIKQTKFFTRKEVRHYYVIRQRDVYPVYSLDYQKNLKPIKRYLDKFSNLYYIGRPGRFRYNNQDHSLEMGMLAARSVIEGQHYDLEKVGEEKEYYESGKVPIKEKKYDNGKLI